MPDVQAQLQAMPASAILAAAANSQQAQSVIRAQATAPAPASAASGSHDYERHGAPFGSINVVIVGTVGLADEALRTCVDIAC